MRKLSPVFVLVAALGLILALAAVVVPDPVGAQAPQSTPGWSFNATIIEACSCPMFCQCSFNPGPSAEHGGHGPAGHYCRFNNAFQVNRGAQGRIKLDGAKFWVAGDLGSDFSKGQMDWAVVHFDPSVTKEQRDVIAVILGQVYPVKWNSFNVAADLPMVWKSGKDRAEARLDGGKAAEIILKRFQGNTSAPIVIQNLKYWGAPRNDGFLLMPNEVEAYHLGPKAYEYKGTNGFMITIDMTAKDVANKG
jgi:hypothetical protein